MATPPQRQASSGSDGDQRLGLIDDRKRRRMESNRESARRSRKRKQEHLDQLKDEVQRMKEGNSKLKQEIMETMPRYNAVEAQNNVLRAQMAELTDRLNSLKEFVRVTEEMMGIQQIADTFIEPWQLPFPFEPITASANMFQY